MPEASHSAEPYMYAMFSLFIIFLHLTELLLGFSWAYPSCQRHYSGAFLPDRR